METRLQFNLAASDRVHGGAWNPWDEECGDEYFDADDDFLWGSGLCFWC